MEFICLHLVISLAGRNSYCEMNKLHYCCMEFAYWSFLALESYYGDSIQDTEYKVGYTHLFVHKEKFYSSASVVYFVFGD